MSCKHFVRTTRNCEFLLKNTNLKKYIPEKPKASIYCKRLLHYESILLKERILSERKPKSRQQNKWNASINGMKMKNHFGIDCFLISILVKTNIDFCIFCTSNMNITDSIIFATQSTSNHFTSLLIAIDYLIIVLYFSLNER